MANISKLPISKAYTPSTIELFYDGEYYATINQYQFEKLRLDILNECNEKSLEPKEDSGYSIVCYPYNFNEDIPTERVTVQLHNDGTLDTVPFEFYGHTLYAMKFVSNSKW